MTKNPPPSAPGAPAVEALAVVDWPVPAGEPVRGTVLLIHGLGEHVARYTELADRLNQWGFAVRGYDQRGHGHSPGMRGNLPADDTLLADLTAFIDDTRVGMDDRQPLILLGHALGALVAAQLVSLKLRRVEALILSSPAFSLDMSLWQRAFIYLTHRFAPGTCMNRQVRAPLLTHDHAAVADYCNDPLVHDRMGVRIARFMLTAGPAVLARAPRWKLPTLLLYGGQDSIINPEGCAAFARAAPAAWVTTQVFAAHYHEVFNEVEREPVFAALHDWLCERFPAMRLEKSGT